MRALDRLLSCSPWRLALLLHFLVLIEQFFLQVIVLLLLLTSLSTLSRSVRIVVSYDVVGYALKLSFAHLLLLNLLDLFLDSQLVLLVVFELFLSITRHLRLSLHHSSLLSHLL